MVSEEYLFEILCGFEPFWNRLFYQEQLNEKEPPTIKTK